MPFIKKTKKTTKEEYDWNASKIICDECGAERHAPVYENDTQSSDAIIIQNQGDLTLTYRDNDTWSLNYCICDDCYKKGKLPEFLKKYLKISHHSSYDGF